MSTRDSSPDHEGAQAGHDDVSGSEYTPPLAEDIETTHNPAEVVAGITTSGTQGIEESSRWH
jgi:hypothetical protein